MSTFDNSSTFIMKRILINYAMKLVSQVFLYKKDVVLDCGSE